MRKSTVSNFQARIEQEKGTAHLTIDALNEAGDFLNNLESDISLIPPNLKKQQLDITQRAPGKYEIDFPVDEMGPYFVNIMQKQHGKSVNTQVTGTVVSYPAEYLVHRVNEILLKQLASTSGGKFAPSPQDAFRAPEQPVVRRIHLWRPLLIIAAFLLLTDIALRRIDLMRERQTNTAT